MTVGRLIALLENFDRESELLLMSQPNWPFEYSVSGVCERQDFAELEEFADSPRKPNDVFLLEGSQLRYGNTNAWGCRSF